MRLLRRLTPLHGAGGSSGTADGESCGSERAALAHTAYHLVMHFCSPAHTEFAQATARRSSVSVKVSNCGVVQFWKGSAMLQLTTACACSCLCCSSLSSYDVSVRFVRFTARNLCCGNCDNLVFRHRIFGQASFDNNTSQDQLVSAVCQNRMRTC